MSLHIQPLRRTLPARSRLLLGTAVALFSLSLPLSLALSGSARAEDSPAQDARLQHARAGELNLIIALLKQGVIQRSQAEALLRKGGFDVRLLDAPLSGPGGVGADTQAMAQAPAPVGSPPVLVNPSTRSQLDNAVEQEVRARARNGSWGDTARLPDWAQHIQVGGDIRIRYLRNDFATDNALAGYQLAATAPASLLPLLAAQQINRLYQLTTAPIPTIASVVGSDAGLQLRARLNVAAAFNEQWKGGLRLSAVGGNDSTVNPVYPDIPLGRSDRPYSAAVSLAYLTWTPGPFGNLTLGRMVNPYFRSDLIFAPDLTLDGVAAALKPWSFGTWSTWLTGGAHPLATNQAGPANLASDQWLLAAQAGVQWLPKGGDQLRVAGAYYSFNGIQGRADPLLPTNNTLDDQSAPAFRQFGNTMFDLHEHWDVTSPLYGYAGQFRLVNLGAEYEWARFDPLRLAFKADFVRNVGFHPGQIAERIGNQLAALPGTIDTTTGRVSNGVTRPRNDGYSLQMRAGADQLRRAGDWQLFGGYRYLERDAVVDAFTSPDYRLGGTDVRGAFVGFSMGLAKNVDVTLRYISAQSIDLPAPFGVDSWFLDVNGRF